MGRRNLWNITWLERVSSVFVPFLTSRSISVTGSCDHYGSDRELGADDTNSDSDGLGLQVKARYKTSPFIHQ